MAYLSPVTDAVDVPVGDFLSSPPDPTSTRSQQSLNTNRNMGRAPGALANIEEETLGSIGGIGTIV